MEGVCRNLLETEERMKRSRLDSDPLATQRHPNTTHVREKHATIAMPKYNRIPRNRAPEHVMSSMRTHIDARSPNSPAQH